MPNILLNITSFSLKVTMDTTAENDAKHKKQDLWNYIPPDLKTDII